MDIATVAGIVLGLLLIVGPIFVSAAGIGAFIDIPSFMIVVGGMFAALMITYPMRTVKSIVPVTMKIFFGATPDFVPLYKSITEMAAVARRDGILALEEKIANLENDFLKRGLQMMVDGNPPEVISAILSKDISNMEDRHLVGNSLYKNMGGYAPAFGMVGTLIGLIQMLQDLSDPNALGLGMAVALITTLYGAFFANLFFIPMAGKLLERSAEESLVKKMLLEGVLSIHAGDSPRIVGDKMLVYMTPAERAEVSEEDAG
ncbi:MAG: motility protein A [Lentisphaeraceae bacterium]|nr:motility protein A [Lentisphaeraceae bacterium]